MFDLGKNEHMTGPYHILYHIISTFFLKPKKTTFPIPHGEGCSYCLLRKLRWLSGHMISFKHQAASVVRLRYTFFIFKFVFSASKQQLLRIILIFHSVLCPRYFHYVYLLSQSRRFTISCNLQRYQKKYNIYFLQIHFRLLLTEISIH